MISNGKYFKLLFLHKINDATISKKIYNPHSKTNSGMKGNLSNDEIKDINIDITNKNGTKCLADIEPGHKKYVMIFHIPFFIAMLQIPLMESLQ